MNKKESKCDCKSLNQNLVNKTKKQMLDNLSLTEISKFYKALSDSTRLKIINALEKNELYVCDIAFLINMSKSAVSHQLKYLRDLNIVKNKKVGKMVVYSLSDNHVKEIFKLTAKHIGECKK